MVESVSWLLKQFWARGVGLVCHDQSSRQSPVNNHGGTSEAIRCKISVLNVKAVINVHTKNNREQGEKES